MWSVIVNESRYHGLLVKHIPTGYNINVTFTEIGTNCLAMNDSIRYQMIPDI